MHFLGKNIRYLRKKLGKNQGEIALLVEKGQTTVGNWEIGVSEPSIKDLLTLSNYFGIPVDDLLRIDLAEVLQVPGMEGHEQFTKPGRSKQIKPVLYRHAAPINDTGEDPPDRQDVMTPSQNDVLTPILKEIESIRREIDDMKARLE